VTFQTHCITKEILGEKTQIFEENFITREVKKYTKKRSYNCNLNVALN
jgi:hypothetical protein